jgi:hypothetical protein
MAVDAGASQMVRWAIPTPIITAAHTNATIARMKRNEEPSCVAGIFDARLCTRHPGRVRRRQNSDVPRYRTALKAS